jgi:hypothetical protein
MNIEIVFFIYRRLAKKSIDFCEEIVIVRDYESDLSIHPTAVIVRFIPKKKRELTKTEVNQLKALCKHHRLGYRFNEKGEMEWYQEKTINLGR